MADCHITCITKPDPQSPHERITHVGNPAAKWFWPVKDVIQSIENKTNTFFVLDSRGNRANVGVVKPTDGRAPYIRTYADGKWTDNLLALNQCPLAP